MAEFVKKTLQIIPEIANAVSGQLTTEQLAGLEKGILAAGKCASVISVWGDIIVDGHNRYKICLKHGLPFLMHDVTKEIGNTLAGAIQYAREQQVNRRQSTPYEESMIRVEIVEHNISLGKTRTEAMTEAAKASGVSKRTLYRDVEFMEGQKKLIPELKADAAAGKHLTKAQVKSLAKMTPEQQKDLVERSGHEPKALKENLDRVIKKPIADVFPARTEVEEAMATTPTKEDVRRASAPPVMGMVTQLLTLLTDMNKTVNKYRKVAGNKREVESAIYAMTQLDTLFNKWKADAETQDFL